MKEKEVQESVAVFNGIEMRISSLDDIWLTQKQIAKMFETSVQNVSKHVIALKKELANWEGLSSVINQQLITEKNGRHEGFTQTRKVEVYGFEFICQVPPPVAPSSPNLPHTSPDSHGSGDFSLGYSLTSSQSGVWYACRQIAIGHER